MIFFNNHIPSFLEEVEGLLASREPYYNGRKVRVVIKDNSCKNGNSCKCNHSCNKECECEKDSKEEKWVMPAELQEEADKINILVRFQGGKTKATIFRNFDAIQTGERPFPENESDFKGILKEASKLLHDMGEGKGIVK